MEEMLFKCTFYTVSVETSPSFSDISRVVRGTYCYLALDSSVLRQLKCLLVYDMFCRI